MQPLSEGYILFFVSENNKQFIGVYKVLEV